jgi:hypothetical protein
MTFSKYIYHFDNGKEKSSGTIDRPAFGRHPPILAARRGRSSSRHLHVAASLDHTRKDKQRAIHRDLRRFATLITKWCD